MTFLSILLFFIKASFFLILNIIPGYITRGFIGIALISLYCYIFRKRNITQTIHINDYKILHPIITCITVVFTLICIISTLFTFKLLNIGNSIDLRDSMSYILNLFKTESYTILIGNCTLILGLIFLAFLVLHYLRAFIYKQLTMIHIYFSQFNDYAFKYRYMEIYNFCIMYCDHISYELNYFLFGKSENNYYTAEERNTHYKYLDFIEKHLSFFVIILCILYDCLFNNFLLTKIYYIFPLTYLYTLWRLLVKFYIKKAPDIDKQLSVIFYRKLEGITENKGQVIIVYTDGIEISQTDINEIKQYVMNECKITKDTGSLIKVIDDFNEFVKNNPKNK